MTSCLKYRVRYITCFVLWLTLFTFYAMRSNISIAMLAMTSQTSNQSVDSYSSCIKDPSLINVVDKHKYEFDWSQSEQGYVLSSFFAGYLSSHLISSLLSFVVGPRIIMICCLLCATGATFSMIILPYWGVWYLIVGRVFIGLFSGPLYPLVHELIAAYAPEEERTIMTAVTHTGNILGLCFNFAFGGYLVEHVDSGWKYLFFMNGCLGVLTLVLWVIFVYSAPNEHPFMNEKEKRHIYGYDSILKATHGVSFKNIPFSDIFSSLQVYIICMATFANGVILFALLTGFPKYLSGVFGIKKSEASYLAIIPFMSNFVFQLIYPFIFNFNHLKEHISKTTYRRINSSIGFIGSCAFLAPVGLVPCEKMSISVLLITFSMVFLGANQSGYFTAMIDLSPRYSGIIMGLASTFGSLSGAIQPQIVSYLIKSGDKKHGYMLTYVITAITSIVLAFPFILFGSSEEQPWSEGKKKSIQQEEQIQLLSDEN